MTRLLTELGYLGFEVSNLARWESFAIEVLGLEVKPGPSSATRLLRMDDQDRRIILCEGAADDAAFVGWQAADAAALDAVARHLQSRGISHSWGNADELALRGVDRMLHFAGPAGMRHEAFCGSRQDTAAFVSPKVASGYLTGDGGLGHVVFGAADYAEAQYFATDIIGAALSDTIRQPIGKDLALDVSFFHLNPRHHSLAFANLPSPKRLNHFMLEVNAIADVGLARDRTLAHGLKVLRDLGQHPNDRMISFYGETPSSFLFEFGWGGVQVDDAVWQVGSYPNISDWGHRPHA